MHFNGLYPEHGTLTLDDVRDRLVFDAHTDRPFVAVNFISTVDGRAAFHGRSGPLSDEGDRAMFHALRERVDAVIAGTGTLRTERYGRLIRDPDARQRRLEAGLQPEPIACVVTRTGALPLDIALFEESQVIVFTSAEVALPDRVQVVHVAPAELTLATVLTRLRADHGVHSLLCEGGPTLFGSLLHERLVDELFLTVAPKLAGGGNAPTVTTGSELSEPDSLRLSWALEREGALFLRFSLP